MKPGGPEILCAAILGGTLTLGLWPFHVPRNDVTWLPGANGLRFGKHGTVFSPGEFRLPEGQNSPSSVSLEIWLQPGRIWDFGTFLAFYTPDDPFRLSLHQWQTGLLVKSGKALRIDSVFPRSGPAFLTITSGPHGTTVYVNGAMARRAPEFRLSAHAFAGRLILGDSPGQSDNWSGKLLGLAIYQQELAPNEVLDHFLTWTRQQSSAITWDERNVALYLFDEHSGTIIHSQGVQGLDLYIPQKYMVVGQMFLETPWSEFRRTDDFWAAVAKNIVGFVPLGFCFYAYFSSVRHHHRAALITVALGFGVSLIIEVLQAFLPMRASGMMDLVTNTLGTCGGVLAYKVVRVLVSA